MSGLFLKQEECTLCVSAETSFGLAAVLAPVGIYCVRTAYQRDCSLLPLSAVPLLFGIQQAVEGLVWIDIGLENARLTQAAALLYLFFALSFWLFWIPFSAAILEPSRRVKGLLGLGAMLGLTGGLLYYWQILSNPAVLLVSVKNHSICYDYTRTPTLAAVPQLVWHLSYLLVVSLPFILVAQKRKALIAFSTAIILSAVISHAYFWYAFSSVWCFFAAILSLMLGYLFYHLPLPRKTGIALIPDGVIPCPLSSLPG